VDNDPKLREALREDEKRISEHLALILNSKSAKADVLKLDGDFAQSFLDVVQNVAFYLPFQTSSHSFQTLDRGLLSDKALNSKARSIIIKLSEACDKLPSSLFISGVDERDEHATFGGGFGDIYRASYAGKNVALKHIRTFQRGPELRRMRLVRFFLPE
jgi:hypothetical protein